MSGVQQQWSSVEGAPEFIPGLHGVDAPVPPAASNTPGEAPTGGNVALDGAGDSAQAEPSTANADASAKPEQQPAAEEPVATAVEGPKEEPEADVKDEGKESEAGGETPQKDSKPATEEG